jgi:hypothetical protein
MQGSTDAANSATTRSAIFLNGHAGPSRGAVAKKHEQGAH